jgi:hypothetical protein
MDVTVTLILLLHHAAGAGCSRWVELEVLMKRESTCARWHENTKGGTGLRWSPWLRMAFLDGLL